MRQDRLYEGFNITECKQATVYGFDSAITCQISRKEIQLMHYHPRSVYSKRDIQCDSLHSDAIIAHRRVPYQPPATDRVTRDVNRDKTSREC